MHQYVLFVLVAVLTVDSSVIRDERLGNERHYVLRNGADLDWWQTAVFYQIYPRSFMDSNNDGIGDLQGIIQRLDYLKDAGITATWLSPIFKSPQVDQGYDISDYRAIQEEYGTMEDLEELIQKAKELGIKIILDFVPNHTSDQHEWFNKSVARVPGYEDYYVWHDGIPDETSDRPKAPNNWISNFIGSAWEWNEQRQQYYYHEFAIQQPDLNYSNPTVVEEMKVFILQMYKIRVCVYTENLNLQHILEFWLDKGVDGFRIDAVPYLFEDPEFRDEPLADGYVEYDENDYNCLEHTLTADLDRTFDMIYQFREVVDAYTGINNVDTRVIMTEAYSPVEKQMRYYGTSDGSILGAHFTFNFNLVVAGTHVNFTVDYLYNSIDLWLSNIPTIYTSNWVLGNHDNHRVASRFGEANVDGFNMLTAILPGVMVTYNGEEIGMEDGEVTCEQGHDPKAIKNCSTFAEFSRDFERTPFQWDNSTNAGFNAGHEPWLPVSSKAKEVNVAAENVTGLSSHYNIYKELMKFRNVFKTPAEFDSVSVIKLSSTVVQVLRRRDESEYSFLFNIGEEEEAVDFYKPSEAYEVVVASVNSTFSAGDPVQDLKLKPHESVIIANKVPN